MSDFYDMPRMDRRKFLAGFLATAASAGVLGKLGLEGWTAEKAAVWWKSWSDAPLISIMPGQEDKISFKWCTDECVGSYEVPERIVTHWISKYA